MGRYTEYKYRVFIDIHQLRTMKIKRIVDRAQNLLLSLTIKEIESLKKISTFTSAGPPGIYMAWDEERRVIEYLSDSQGNRYWRQLVLDNQMVDQYDRQLAYGGVSIEINELSFSFAECQGLACPFRFVPTHINNSHENIRAVINWRLQLGR